MRSRNCRYFVFSLAHSPLSLEPLVDLLERVILDLLDGLANVHAVGDGGLEAEDATVADVLGKIRLNA